MSRKRPRPYLHASHSFEFCLVWQDNHVHFSQESPSPSRDLNPKPPIDRYVCNFQYHPTPQNIKGTQRESPTFLITRSSRVITQPLFRKMQETECY